MNTFFKIVCWALLATGFCGSSQVFAASPAAVAPTAIQLLPVRAVTFSYGLTAAEQMSVETVGTMRDRSMQMNGRLRYNQLKEGRGQYGVRQKRFLLQMGGVFNESEAGNGSNSNGLFGIFSRSNADVYDYLRPTLPGLATPLSAHAGDVTTQYMGAGYYHTYSGNNGLYVDVSAQAGHLKNNFKDTQNFTASQKGWNIALSAEVGKSIRLNDTWSITPQGQLIVSHTKMGDAKGGLVVLHGATGTLYRGRAGATLHTGSDTDTTRFYLLGNIWSDLNGRQRSTLTVGNITNTVGSSKATVWGELGLGLQIATGENTNVYFDVRGERAQGNQRKHENVSGQMGLSTSW